MMLLPRAPMSLSSIRPGAVTVSTATAPRRVLCISYFSILGGEKRKREEGIF